jgi:hypothetical protein
MNGRAVASILSLVRGPAGCALRQAGHEFAPDIFDELAGADRGRSRADNLGTRAQDRYGTPARHANGSMPFGDHLDHMVTQTASVTRKCWSGAAARARLAPRYLRIHAGYARCAFVSYREGARPFGQSHD